MGIIDRIKAKTDLKLAQIERELDFGNGTMRKWDTSLPSFDKVIAVADLIGVSTDYLAGREETKKEPTVITNDGLNPKILKVIRLLETKDIPDDVVDFILKGLENIK